MKKRTPKKMIILVFALSLSIVFIMFLTAPTLCLKCFQRHVVHDYCAAAGIKSTKYEDVIANYGDPVLIDQYPYGEGKKYVRLEYDSLVFCYELVEEEKYYFKGFEVYTPDIQFRRNVHVGSTRNEIKHVYTNAQAWTSDATMYSDNPKGSCSWDRVVIFEYDSNNKVTCIKYYPIWA